MLCYRQILFILVGFFSLSSCDVTPLYKSEFKNALLNNNIYVENIDTEIGFYLSQNLRFSLKDTGQKKRLKLIVTINTSERKYALSSDNEETRIQKLSSRDEIDAIILFNEETPTKIENSTGLNV